MAIRFVIGDSVTINSDSDDVIIFETTGDVITIVVSAKDDVVWATCVLMDKLVNILGAGTSYTFNTERMKAIVDIVGDKMTFDLFLSCLERE